MDGSLGWARAMGDAADTEALTGGLGSRWEITRNTYKPYPAGIVFHAVIDACLRLRPRIRAPADSIAAVVVNGSALLLRSAERRAGKECASACRVRWMRDNKKKT